MRISVEAPNQPTLIKTSEELQTVLRKGINDTTVDLLILKLESAGEATVTFRGLTLTLKKIGD
jgi:hypothetical protein